MLHAPSQRSLSPSAHFCPNRVRAASIAIPLIGDAVQRVPLSETRRMQGSFTGFPSCLLVCSLDQGEQAFYYISAGAEPCRYRRWDWRARSVQDHSSLVREVAAAYSAAMPSTTFPPAGSVRHGYASTIGRDGRGNSHCRSSRGGQSGWRSQRRRSATNRGARKPSRPGPALDNSRVNNAGDHQAAKNADAPPTLST